MLHRIRHLLNVEEAPSRLSASMTTRETTPRTWRQEDSSGHYVISTSALLLNRDFITGSLATEDMYWAEPLSPEQLELTLSQSLTFGLYISTPASFKKHEGSPLSPRTPSPTLEPEKDEDLEQIGLARFVTDHVTFVYISDVYIVRDHRGKGLGTFLERAVMPIGFKRRTKSVDG